MAITIADNGASLKINDGTLVRNVTKGQIIEISVIKVDIIRIDIGQGALRNIFIPYSQVTSPVTANAAALRDKLNDFLVTLTGGLAGAATEAKQTEQIDVLNAISGNINTVKGLVTTIDNKTFYEELLVDDSGIGVIYKGYAVNAGTRQDQPLWAIKRTRKEGDVEVSTWADGNKNFDNSWIDRESLAYS